MEVDLDDLPVIEEKKTTSPLKQSSPQKHDETKENAAPEAKAVTKSWLVFNEANLFADDDKSSVSSISLPDLGMVDNEEGELLKLDGSSFLDEHEGLKLKSGEHSTSSVTGSEKKSRKKFKKTKPRKGDDSDSDSETGLEILKKLKKSKKKKHKKQESNNDDLPEIEGVASQDSGGEAANANFEEGVSPQAVKRSKRLSKKELQKMHSDAQRVLREAPVSIPIRQAEPLNLDDILEEVASINPEVKKMLEEDEKKKKKKAEEAKKVEEAKKAKEAKKAEEAKKVEEVKKADEAKKGEEAKKADDEKKEEVKEGQKEEVEDGQKEAPEEEQTEKPDDLPEIAVAEVGKEETDAEIAPIEIEDGSNGSSDVELEIVEESDSTKKKSAPPKPVNPGVAWLMQRFKKHNMAGRTHHVGHDDQTSSGTVVPPSSWEEVKEQLQEEMAELREKGLQERIERYKVENEELDDQEPEEEEAPDDSEDNSDDDKDSYSTITDEDETEEEKQERLKKKRAKKAEKNAATNVFLDREAAETGSEDEDYQPSEGHREEGGASTDEGSIKSEDEKVQSGSEDSDSDAGDSDEIDDDDDLVETTSDEEEEILRRSSKKKPKKRKKEMDSDSSLPDLVIEDRPAVNDDADVALEPSAESSEVMPPDMPAPNELFPIYNEPKSNQLGGEDDPEPPEMDDLLGLCTGPFMPVERKDDSSTEISKGEPETDSNNVLEEEVPPMVKASKVVYGHKKAKKPKTTGQEEIEGFERLEAESEVVNPKSDKKERRKYMREFFEREAELSDSDEEGSHVSSDEYEGSSDHDAYETDSEFEDDALAKLSANQLKKQVESIHMKQVIDEDERNLLQLRETIIPDADLADAVGPRLRRFRWAQSWRDIGGMDMAPEGGNAQDDDDYLGLSSLDNNAGSGSLSSMWQKQRVERERWLGSQKNDENELDSQATATPSSENELSSQRSNNDSELVRFGLSAMRKSSSGNGSFTTTVAESSTLIAAPVPRRLSHGSMLSWLHDKELDKIAQTMTGGNNSNTAKNRKSAGFSAGGANPKPEELMAGSSFASRVSAGPFIVMSDDSPNGSDRKRKFDSGSGSTASASKRGKPQQSSSVFDFLS